MEREVPIPHMLIFPFPFQVLSNMPLNSNHNHKCLLPFTGAEARFRRWPKFLFETITDSLPAPALLNTSLKYKFKIPIISFRTISACSFWAYFCIPKLIAAGKLPFQGDMDVLIKCVLGMEGFSEEFNGPVFQSLLRSILDTTRASGFILNSFKDLEGHQEIKP
ncbi:hypothetical protein NE237_013481 [Protea cynaroides]|uniref:Uncharacterized protein n=1 Tax=Protea cynaroides TaxID=273540 RepID=A0A9Q0GZF6_9MAGN|nr:hypothetical protein NE237_013481 [Protea cynaroides]